MKCETINPPRTFEVGLGCTVLMSDCAHIHLRADEQVTLMTASQGQYDVARKDWGFYATPSLNGRLSQYGLRGVLVKNRMNRYFVLLVERNFEQSFHDYLSIEGLNIVCWLDTDEALRELELALHARSTSSVSEG